MQGKSSFGGSPFAETATGMWKLTDRIVGQYIVVKSRSWALMYYLLCRPINCATITTYSSFYSPYPPQNLCQTELCRAKSENNDNPHFVCQRLHVSKLNKEELYNFWSALILSSQFDHEQRSLLQRSLSYQRTLLAIGVRSTWGRTQMVDYNFCQVGNL